jgi:hypothetical protein
MDLVYEDMAMTSANFPASTLSDDLQAIIGLAIVDGAFQQLLLTNPRRALAAFDLSSSDRRAANAITGASSLAEYAVLLEQRLAGSKHRRVAVGQPSAERQPRARKAG